jgi:hypothetical protein
VSKTPIGATLASSLQSLAECRLQIQTSRAAALYAGAVGLMGVDVTVAALIVAVRGATDLWLLALAGTCVAFAGASTALLMRDAGHIGPSIAEVMARWDAGSDHDLVREILDDLSARVLANQQALGRKEPRLANALMLTLVAVLVELASQLH